MVYEEVEGKWEGEGEEPEEARVGEFLFLTHAAAVRESLEKSKFDNLYIGSPLFLPMTFEHNKPPHTNKRRVGCDCDLFEHLSVC